MTNATWEVTMSTWDAYQERCRLAGLRLAGTPPKSGWAKPKTPKPPKPRKPKITEEEKEANRLKYMRAYRDAHRQRIRDYNRDYKRIWRAKNEH